MDLEVRAAGAQVEEARNLVIEAHAAGNDAEAAKLRKRLKAVEEDAKRLREEKLVGVQRAQQRAEADRVKFAADDYAALLDERARKPRRPLKASKRRSPPSSRRTPNGSPSRRRSRPS